MIECSTFSLAMHLTAMDAEDDAFASLAGQFVTSLSEIVQHRGVEILNSLRELGLSDRLKVASKRADVQKSLALALELIAERTSPDLSGSLVSYGVCANLTFLLDLIKHKPAQNLLLLIEWFGRCSLIESNIDIEAPYALDPAWHTTTTEELHVHLVKALHGSFRERSAMVDALTAVKFLNTRTIVRYVIQLAWRDRSFDEITGATAFEEELASLVLAPLHRLGAVGTLLRDRRFRDIILAKYEAHDNLLEQQKDIDLDLRQRTVLAELLVEELGSVKSKQQQDGMLRALGLCAPRGYSSELNYRPLQSLRALSYDRVARMRYDNVDLAPVAMQTGAVGLLMATLARSAECNAAVMYAAALHHAGFSVKIIIWPHSQGSGESDAAICDTFDVLDLRQIPFETRVKVVRALGLECLLSMNNVTWGWSEYIAACCFRLAHIQVATYLSVITVGFQNIDYYLVGSDSEGPNAAGHYIERLLWLEGSVLCLQPAEHRQIDDRAAQRRPLVAACGSSLLKLTPRSIEEIFSICALVGIREIYFYPYNPSWGLSPSKAFELNLRVIAKRCEYDGEIKVVGPWSDQSAIFSLLDRCDLYFDSYPHSGGLSVLDAISRGLPVVYRSGPSQRGLQARNVVVAAAARGIDLSRLEEKGLTPPERDAFIVSLLEEPSASADFTTHPIFNVHSFASDIAHALLQVDIRPTRSNLPFRFSSVGNTVVLRPAGRQVLFFDDPMLHPGIATPAHSGALLISLMPSFEAQFVSQSSTFQSKICEFRFTSKRDQLVVFALPVTNAEAGEQLCMITGGLPSGWTHPIIAGATTIAYVVCNVTCGHNLISVHSSAPLSKIRLVGSIKAPATGSISKGERAAIWSAIAGFSFWEGANVEYGLESPFRWAIGATSTIRVLVDGPDAHQGMLVEVQVASATCEITISTGGAILCVFRRETGRLEHVEVIEIWHPFANGYHDLQFDSKVERVSSDRDLTMVIKKVSLVSRIPSCELAAVQS